MRIRLSLLAVPLLALIGAAPAQAAFTPVTSAGGTPAAIRPAVDGFATGLGTDDGSAAGSQAGGRREIDWDDVADASAYPAALPGDHYNAVTPRGAVFSTPLAVSSGTSRFAGVDPSYTFSAYSPERIAAPAGTNVTDVSFRVPGTDTPALVSGFGAVFSDVDLAGTTRIDYFDAAGALLGSVAAAPGALSFAGASGVPIARVRITAGTAPLGPGSPDDATHDVVAMDDVIYGEPRTPAADYHLGQAAYAVHESDGHVTIAVRRSGALAAGSVRLTTLPGTATAGADYGQLSQTVSFAPGQEEQDVPVTIASDTATEGDETFTVSLDQPAGGFVGAPGSATVTIHDDPPAKAVKPPDHTRPTVKVSGVPSHMRWSRFVKGFRVRVRTNEAASLDALVTGHTRQARISRAYNLTLARTRQAMARGTRTLRLRPNRGLVGSARRFTVHLQVLAVDRAGNRRTVTRAIHVTRAGR